MEKNKKIEHFDNGLLREIRFKAREDKELRAYITQKAEEEKNKPEPPKTILDDFIPEYDIEIL